MTDIKGVDETFKGCLNLFISEIIYRHDSAFPSAKFSIEIKDGRRYVKVIERGPSWDLVHSFVEKSTGNIYKAASWKAPANKERGNIYSQGGLGAFGEDWQIRYL